MCTAPGPTGTELPVSYQPDGRITRRLLALLPANDPAQPPIRSSYARPLHAAGPPGVLIHVTPIQRGGDQVTEIPKPLPRPGGPTKPKR